MYAFLYFSNKPYVQTNLPMWVPWICSPEFPGFQLVYLWGLREPEGAPMAGFFLHMGVSIYLGYNDKI
jgi:hypothetical protein